MANDQTAVATAEQGLREHIERMRRGETPRRQAEDIIFVNGAYPRPLIGRAQLAANPTQERLLRERLNYSVQSSTQRLVAAQSGDLAYEYGTSQMSWDTAEGKHVDMEAVWLRVWQKVDGEWEVAVFFGRPNQSEPA